ncbi:hypothetical protein [Cryobacterium sp. BB736]|uniref:hypothetical protein n=1 Tax=Cryobacterium sp. BB736 TaxID=2746963 RepID=UPI00187662CB|nr:hypothetical protein [Cryobacterium sp. BB736]
MLQRATAPTGEKLVAFGAALENAGVVGEAVPAQLAEAVSNSIEGVRAKKSDTQAVSPLTPSVALLQNLRGMQGVKNPPDLGEILERLFALGKIHPNDLTACGLWSEAAEQRLYIDPLLAAIDAAADKTLLETPRTKRDGGLAPRQLTQFPTDAATPFAWFHDSWTTLTRKEWVEALPGRVWVDWATTVLRLGFGLGYLWESLWYETLARKLLSQGTVDVAWDAVRADMSDVIPWRSARSGVQARDVAPLLGRRSYRADQVRHVIDDWADGKTLSDMTFIDACKSIRSDPNCIARLESALRSTARTQSGKNLWEASQYALLTRTVSGPSADYYGLLRRNGRFLTVEPGTEWIAVVASLAAGRPGESTTVAAVLASLDRMGIRPELSDLIVLLERAGLARGSADADQAVWVQAAF